MQNELIISFTEKDYLKRLIEILTESSKEFLEGDVDPNRLPGLSYKAVLSRLIQLKTEWDENRTDMLFMEDLMINWAKTNDPEEVDDKLFKKIRATAPVLEEWLKNMSRRNGKLIFGENQNMS